MKRSILAAVVVATFSIGSAHAGSVSKQQETDTVLKEAVQGVMAAVNQDIQRNTDKAIERMLADFYLKQQPFEIVTVYAEGKEKKDSGE